MSKKDGRKSVVVVGGGSAGVNIARPLSSQLDPAKYKLVLINPRPFRVLLPAALRMVVSNTDNLENTALVPFDKIFHKNGTFLQDSVEGIHQDAGQSSGVVVLAKGEAVPYDVLILATGLSWPDPIAFPDVAAEVAAYIANSREKFARAQSYLLVGGGAVGCELAGELKDRWPAKEVTIVHGHSLLLNDTYPVKFRALVAAGLEARGVKFLFNQVVGGDDLHASTVVTRTGLELCVIADLIVRTTGATHPNTGFIKSFDADVLTSAGFVKVKPTLQLPEYPNIFAAGDIIDWNEQKQALKSSAHAQLVTKNVIGYLKGTSLKSYSTKLEGISLTNGKHGGLTYFGVLWGIILGAWFTGSAKSKSLLVPMLRKESGL
ncbi:hypothetical protein C8R46DRAFT_1109448 [Mycena filopes]|nr:hypothetical protein C8R46DRAFT_1109448 [Mycena filopes]